MIATIKTFLTTFAVELGSLAAILAIVEYFFSPFRLLASRWAKPQKMLIANPQDFRPAPAASIPPNTVQMDVQAFVDLQTRLKAEARAELATAHGLERKRLEEKIEILNARLANPEEALAQQQAIINDLEAKLARRGNDLGGDALAAARASLEQGDFTAAKALFETLAADTAPNVAAHADAAFALGQIAESEIRWQDAATHYATAARLNPTFDTLYKARLFAWRAGNFPAAFRHGEALIAIARNDPDQAKLADALNEHAITLEAQGVYSQAEALFNRALDITRQTIGEAHPGFAARLNNLAGVVAAQGRYAEAEALYNRALDIGRNTIGEAHPAFATKLNNLAGVVQAQGRHPEAETLYNQALEIDRKTIGEAHPDFATNLNNLAVVVEAQGRYAEAEALFNRALDITRNTIGEAHPAFAIRLNNLAGVVEAQGCSPEAETLYNQALVIFRKALGDTHPDTQTFAHNYATLLKNHRPDAPELPALLKLRDAPKS